MPSIYANPWFHVQHRNPSAALRLFCFPYAGGDIGIYRDWFKSLPAFVEVVAVQYPGRGIRFGEALVSSCDGMVSALSQHRAHFLEKPFAFFGHSSGALVSFELARELHRKGGARQVHHFISGRRALHLPRPGIVLHSLPDDEFIAELVRFGGTSSELLSRPEIMEVFLPILRADFAIGENFEYAGPDRLCANASLLFGEADAGFSSGDLDSWNELIQGDVDSFGCAGGHFFVNSHRAEVLRFVRSKLEKIAKREVAGRSISLSGL